MASNYRTRRIAVLLLVFAVIMGIMPAAQVVTYSDSGIEVESLQSSYAEYLDEYGTTRQTPPNPKFHTGTQSGGLSDGWHVLSGDGSWSDRPVVLGAVHIVLENGSRWSFPRGIQVGAGSSLTIYANSVDSEVMGELIADASEHGGISHLAGIGGGSGEAG